MNMYHTDGWGNWTCTTFPEQCPEQICMGWQCQGIKGHKDIHWSYREDGSLAWSDNEQDPKHDLCSGLTPPGHSEYINPVDMTDKCYLSQPITVKITDSAMINMLEKDITPNENDSITRPVV